MLLDVALRIAITKKMEKDLSLNITPEGGQTWWSMVSSSCKLTSLELVEDTSDPVKGFGVMTRSPVTKGSLIYYNYAVSSVLMNWKDSEICLHCWQVISKSAKCSSLCKHLRFCSQECVRANEPFISKCGKAVNALTKAVNPMETHLLALNLLYRLSVAVDPDEIQQILYIFQLKGDIRTNLEESKRSADIFYDILSSEAPPLLEEVLWFFDFDRNRARQLFQIILLNSQPMYIYGVKCYTILCLLPTVARMNHSCQPNCELILQIEEEEVGYIKSKTARLFAQQLCNPQHANYKPRRILKVSVLATSDIKAGSELTLSYLSNLYESTPERQHFLSEGFYFQCHCVRCVSELSIDHYSNSNNSSEPINRIVAQQMHLDRMLHESIQDTDLLTMAKSEDLVCICEGLMLDIIRAHKEHCISWSASSVYHACLLVIERHETRFRKLAGQWKDYLEFGLLFFRAGKLMCDVWAHIQCPTRSARLELMTKVCLCSALAAKSYLETRVELEQYFSVDKVVAMIRGSLGLIVEAAVIVDTIYLNNEDLRERESEVGTDDTLTLGETWHYMRILRDKAFRVRTYLRNALDRLTDGDDGNS